MVGKKLLHYHVVEKLGEGGMGSVYLARDTRLERNVALKFIREGTTGSVARERFLREARAASKLTHPNIVGIHSIESIEEGDFMVMEYVEGRPLSDVVTEGEVPIDLVLTIAREVALALSAAHGAGIVHRDIKPDNVLLTTDGHVKVLDFGIARVTGADPLTRTDATLGTLAYMSPEQARGEEVDARSDLFSYGAVLYEAATGTSPFRGDYAAATVFRIINEDPPPPRQMRDGLPDTLDRLITRCLKKERDDRFASADDVAAALSDLDAVGQPVAAATPVVSTRNKMPRRSAFIAAGTVIAVGIAVAAYLLLRPTPLPSIAVMPFVNGTGDEAVEFLCSGIPESLINRLSPVPGLKVISRASSFAVSDTAEDPSELGRMLDVRTVLLGRLEMRGDDLSISTELVDTRENRQLWGEKYRRPASEILDLEDEIATSIATRLRGRLTSYVEKTVTESGTTNSEAYRLYLQGQYLAYGRQRDSRRAIELLRQATDLDPDFALAWAGIAQAMAIQAYLAYGTREELLEGAQHAMQKALDLEPNLSESHNAAGLIRFYFDWDWEGAEAAFRRAIALNPGNARAHNRYSTFLIAMERADEALTMAQRAAALDPISTGPTHDLGIVYFIRGDNEAAVRQFDKAVELHPNWSWGYVKGALANARAGNSERALELVAVGQQKVDGWGGAFLQSWIAWVYKTVGRLELVEETLQKMLDHAKYEHVDAMSLAQTYAAVEDDSNTLRYLEKAVDEKSPDAVFLRGTREGFFRRVSDDPRFKELLRRMNYPDLIL